MKIRLRRSRKLAGGLGLLLALALVVTLSGASLADGVPTTEHSFFGSVQVCGEQVIVGTEVLAKNGDIERTTSVDSEGNYGLKPNTLKVPGEVGDTVEFWVLGKKVAEVQPDPWWGFTELPLNVTEVDLTVNSGTGGTVTDPGVGTFPRACGVEVNLLADPDPGYDFDEWTGDVAAVAAIDDSTADDTFITMNGFYEITATFTPVGEPHDLTVTSDGCCTITVGELGEVDPGATEVLFPDIPYGTEVELEALPPDCCSFVEWEVDGGDPVGVNPITVTMDADHTAIATCTEVGLLTLTVDVVGEGDVQVNDVAPGAYPEEYEFDCCTDVDLEAFPAEGWFFTGWSDDLSGTENPTTIHMDGNKTVTANFAPEEETYLTVNSTDGGSVTSPSEGMHSYPGGTEVPLVATPDQCASFVNWTGDDVSTVADVNDATTTITMNDDYTITANFESPEVLTTIPLSTDYNGWNTFSTPIYLDPCCNTWDDLVALSGLADDVEMVYYYDAFTGQWGHVETGHHQDVTPLEGFYVKLREESLGGTVSIIPYWDNPEPDIPPSKELAHQLNFIGTPSLEDRDIVSALGGIYYIPGVGYSRVINPEENPNDWLEADYYRDDTPVPTMVAFKAYWIIMGWWEGPVYLYGSLPPPPTP